MALEERRDLWLPSTARYSGQKEGLACTPAVDACLPVVGQVAWSLSAKEVEGNRHGFRSFLVVGCSLGETYFTLGSVLPR